MSFVTFINKALIHAEASDQISDGLETHAVRQAADAVQCEPGEATESFYIGTGGHYPEQ